jgi:hypothetical protein
MMNKMFGRGAAANKTTGRKTAARRHRIQAKHRAAENAEKR